MATATALMTFADLERMPDSDIRYELRHGELIELPPPKYGHLRIQGNIRRALEKALGDLGKVEIEFGFRARREHEYRIADAAFVSRARVRATPDDGYLMGAPELVVEVLSPSNTASEILDKEQLCLENGSREFRVVDPIRRQIKVSTSDGHSLMYREGQSIPLFLGGIVSVGSIFAFEED